MSSEEIRERTQRVWDRFYDWKSIWKRSACTPTLRARVAFMFLSKPLSSDVRGHWNFN